MYLNKISLPNKFGIISRIFHKNVCLEGKLNAQKKFNIVGKLRKNGDYHAS